MTNLSNRLSALADDMTDVDYTALRDLVDVTSRRRAITTSVAAMALIGVVSVGGMALASPADETNQADLSYYIP